MLLKRYESVVFVGNPDCRLKSLLDAQGVKFSNKPGDASRTIFIVDGSVSPGVSARQNMQKQIAKGADVWIWGITPATVESYNGILPLCIQLDELNRSSFLPVQKSWLRGLNNSDFYFCELQKADAARYTLKGDFVEEGEVLLHACRTDWRKWNKRPEEIKTAGTLRSEYECTAATPVFVKYQGAGSAYYISTLTEFANSEKGYNTLTAILTNAGIPYEKPKVNIDEVFFLRDNQMNFPVATKKLMRKEGNLWSLELYVFSPRPLDDLLIEPDMPKLSLFVKAKQRRFFINDKPYSAAAREGRNEIEYKELPLLQGWNKLVLEIGDEDYHNRDFTAFFKCDNQQAFLGLLKAGFVNPEAK